MMISRIEDDDILIIDIVTVGSGSNRSTIDIVVGGRWWWSFFINGEDGRGSTMMVLQRHQHDVCAAIDSVICRRFGYR